MRLAYTPSSPSTRLNEDEMALRCTPISNTTRSLGSHLEVSASSDEDVEAVTKLVLGALPAELHARVDVNVTLANVFEYPGTYRAWRLGVEHPEDVIAYIHSKGASKKDFTFALRYFTGTFAPVRSVLQMFARCRWVTHAGPLCAKNNVADSHLTPRSQGFVWQNFWYARGSYLARLEEPRLYRAALHRYYYELWLGRLRCRSSPVRDMFGAVCFNDRQQDCFSMFHLRTSALSYSTGKKRTF